jgi:hypothetical protein
MGCFNDRCGGVFCVHVLLSVLTYYIIFAMTTAVYN